ncbi:hypothetical protein TNCV_1731581 [Trichonephila clavipes]|nr:hypothetical protein TNCV_1731581 [Trichonephila clavipes]
MDDNAPCHRTVAAEQLLESDDIECMDWPARSPDLNPIEHEDFLRGFKGGFLVAKFWAADSGRMLAFEMPRVKHETAELEGKSCARVKDVGIDAVSFCFENDDAGCSSFKGGHFIFVIVSSGCVEEDVIHDLSAWHKIHRCGGWRSSSHRGVQQGRDSAGRLAKASSVSSGTPKRGATSRLTEAGSLLPPVYS